MEIGILNILILNSLPIPNSIPNRSGKYHGICLATSDVSVFTLNHLLNCEKGPLLQSWMLLLLFLVHDTLPSLVSEDLCIGIDCDLTDRCIWGKACVKKYGALWNCMFCSTKVWGRVWNLEWTTAVCCTSLSYNSKPKPPWFSNP
jgi:hypothetical protein